MTQDNPASSQVVLIGECLRLRREETRMSLEKVSQKTKISLNMLKALEANDFAALPSAAYVKGFVLSYARAVGLSPADIITKLEYTYLTVTGQPFPALNHTRNMGPSVTRADETVAHGTAAAVAPADVLAHEDAVRDRRRVIVPSLVFGGIALVFVGMYQLVTRTIENESGVESSRPAGPTFVPSSELVEMNRPVQQTSAAGKKPTESAAAAATPAEAKPAPVSPAAEIRRNFPPKDFRRISVRLFTVIPDSPEASDTAIFPDERRRALNPELENVYVRALEGNTWLSYKIDAQPIVSVVLEKGGDLFLQGKEILMFIGNVKVTRIFYQNRLIDPPTKTGFKSLVFPESKATGHMLPLFPKASDDILYTAEEYQRRMKIEEEELAARKP